MVVRPPSLIVRLLIATLLITVGLAFGHSVGAQTDGMLAPAELTGDVVYVPFPVAIELDGKLDDWQNVPLQVVTKGTSVSTVAGENGPLSFAVAADATTFYIRMTIVDQTIVTGQHGAEYWNEDSLEFFLNTSGNVNASGYGNGIFQANINPGDIGNSDPAALTLTGTNVQAANVRAFVFATDDGWGFEAAVPLSVTPTHGLEIGFQAQSNGATAQDREVKLIWSNADKSDSSWQNPYVFGRALFYEIGRTDVPTAAAPIAPATATPPPTPTPPPVRISVNQTGYYPNAPKHATLPSDATTPLTWRLRDGQGNTLLEGETTVHGGDVAAGENVHTINFSAFTTPGSGYQLQVAEIESEPFDIAPDIYARLPQEALAYFYLNRSGIPIEARYTPGEMWARPAGHLSDNSITCISGPDAAGNEWPGCDYTLDVSGGWYDAGDYGKYVVNGGISVWTLLNLYEHMPDLFPDGALKLPENGNGIPDILDEARWELEFLLSMQVPAGQPLAGMAHHKLHGMNWDPMPSRPPEQSTANGADGGRYLFPPSTAATLNLAATAAQCARIWKTLDPQFSARCLTAAETAWEAASANPVSPAVIFDAGGGAYDDDNVADEFYWAAAELYISTGEDQYQDFLLSSPNFADTATMYWGGTDALGTISLAVVPNALPSDRIAEVRQSVIDAAAEYIRIMSQEGYRVPLPATGYVWGSNSDVLNRMLLMGLAHDFTQEQVYLDGMIESMDYLLGRNPLNKSYISGYGENPLQYPHHRFWGNQPALGYPPPPSGVVAGGPNGSPSDSATEAAGLTGNPPAKTYLDEYDSYSTNEITINWNAPLVWTAAYLDQVAGPAYAPPDQATASAPTVAEPPASFDILWLAVGTVLGVLAVGGIVFWFRRSASGK